MVGGGGGEGRWQIRSGGTQGAVASKWWYILMGREGVTPSV